MDKRSRSDAALRWHEADVLERAGRLFVSSSLNAHPLTVMVFFCEVALDGGDENLGAAVGAALTANRWVDDLSREEIKRVEDESLRAVGVKNFSQLTRGAKLVGVSRRGAVHSVRPLVRKGSSFVNPEYAGVTLATTEFELREPSMAELGRTVREALALAR